MTASIGHDVTIVDACTRRGRGGSPTAVLIDDGALSDSARCEIVRRAGTSHAAFVDAEAETTPTVRFFTAGGELTNCGHGTIAAQAVLLHRRPAAERHARQRTGGRTFDITAIHRDDGIEVWFDQGEVQLRDCTAAGLGRILAALGIRSNDVSTDDFPCVASPGTPRLLVPVTTLPTLLSMRPDPGRLAAECRRLGYLGCFVYTLSPTGDAAAARMFAPAIGVGEDVVNANSTGCLAAHLVATNRPSGIEVVQGHTAGRPSSVFATAAATTDGISARVGGMATIRSSTNGAAH